MAKIRLKQLDQDGATNGQVVAWNNTNGVWEPTTGGGGGLNNVVEDTTPQLGGTLDCQSNEIDNVELITYEAEHDNGDSGTADTIDWNNGQKQRSRLTGNVTYTFTAPPGPGNFILKTTQDTTGGRTITWPGTVLWPGGTAPVGTSPANSVDIWSFYYDGTNYYAVMSANYS